jgi:hypothetical protein
VDPSGKILSVAEVLEEEASRTPARNILVFLDNRLSISRIYNMPQRTMLFLLFAFHTTDKMNPLGCCSVNVVKTLFNKKYALPNKIMLVVE